MTAAEKRETLKKVKEARRSGLNLQDACEKSGISAATFYNWTTKRSVTPELSSDSTSDNVGQTPETGVTVEVKIPDYVLQQAAKKLVAAKLGITAADL